MHKLLLSLALLSFGGLVSSADAGPVLDRVKAQGVVHCGSAERPGLASAAADQWKGLNVDVCRAVAVAVLGSAGKVAFHEYETPKQFDAVRNGDDDLFFLTASEINENHLAGKVLPGPTVFIESHAVLVPKSSPAKSIKDLAGQPVCFMIASGVERSLSNYFGKLGKEWIRMGYSEDGEMTDAYLVQQCHAVAYESTTLAQVPLDPGINKVKSRVLPDVAAVFPIVAATGTNDAEWSAIVAWTVHTLISAERPETQWYDGGAKALPIAAPELGLDNGWQDRVIKAVGHYGSIFERNLGKKSPLKLARGLNANQTGGGMMLSPFLE